MLFPVNFIKVENIKSQSEYRHNKEIDFLKEVKIINSKRVSHKKTAFELNNLNAFFRDRKFFEEEVLISSGNEKSGVIRCLEYTNKNSDFYERVRIFNVLSEIMPKYIFVEKYKGFLNSNDLYSFVRKSKNIDKKEFSDLNAILRDMKKTILHFCTDGKVNGYKPGQKLTPDQREIFKKIDPVFIYLFLTRGAQLHGLVVNGEDHLKAMASKIQNFYSKNKGVEAVWICSKKHNVGQYLSEKKIPQKIYTFNCLQSVLNDILARPVFEGNSDFGTILFLEKKSIIIDSKNEKNLQDRIASKKSIFDILIAMRIEFVFEEGFFGHIEKANISQKELNAIQILQERFANYDPNEKLNAEQAESFEQEHPALLYYYLAPVLFSGEVKVCATTTEEQAKKEEKDAKNKGMHSDSGILTLNEQDTRILANEREESAVKQMMQFFTNNSGQRVALIFSEKNNLERFLGTEIEGQQFNPRYYRFPTARNLNPDKVV